MLLCLQSQKKDTSHQQQTQKQQQQQEEKQQQEKTVKEPARAVNPKVLNLVRSSKFRHIEGAILHKSTHIDSIPPLHKTIPGDSNAFSCNNQLMAVALNMAGGQIAVFEVSVRSGDFERMASLWSFLLSIHFLPTCTSLPVSCQTNKPGRLPSNIPTIENIGSIMDFMFDPFNSRRLVVSEWRDQQHDYHHIRRVASKLRVCAQITIEFFYICRDGNGQISKYVYIPKYVYLSMCIRTLNPENHVVICTVCGIQHCC